MADEKDAKIEFDEAQQARVNELVGAARVKARDQAKADFEAAQAKAKEEAEKTTLAAEAKWQELAQKHEARATELEPFETEAKAYRKLVTTMLKDRVKELGEDAKKAVDALPSTLTDLDKLAWLNTNAELFEVTGDGVGTPNRPKPKSGGKHKAKDAGHRRMRI